MNEAIKKQIRPLVLPCLHAWQWLHDYGRSKLREFSFRLRMVGDRPVIATDVHGIRFVLYPFDVLNVSFLIYRSTAVGDFQAMSRLVQPGDLAFDIGANIGIYSVFLSRLCGSAGRVWAFEPVPDTYWRLRETLALNRCETVIPIQAAISENSGRATMNLFEPQFAEWNSLGRPLMRSPDGTRLSPCQTIEVPSLTLDQFCDREQIGRVNFLKVDVEGFELSVFRGAQHLLSERRVDYICFEISKQPLKGAGVDSRSVFEALEAHGYPAYRFDMKTGTFRGPIRDTEEEWTNFFASCRDLRRLNGTSVHASDIQPMLRIDA